MSDPEPGVAVLCERRGLTNQRIGPRPYPENVLCNEEYWPFTASSLGLYTLLVKQGDRALCAGG